MAIPNHPIFVPPHEHDSGGVDYLGLRALNLRLMASLVPGLNNVVDSVRPFALISWVVWCHQSQVEKLEAELDGKQFELFRQKIETLYIWSHVAAGDAYGLVGNQQRMPSTGAEGSDYRMPLNFAAVGRSKTNTFLDAAQYGPSLKAPDGLGFIYPVGDGKVFKVTATAGTALATALDESLRSHLSSEHYQALRSMDVAEGNLKDWPGLLDAWHVDKPTEKEQEAFRAQLFQLSEIGKASPPARRSALLYVCREILREEAVPMSASDLRRRIACNPLPLACAEHEALERFAEIKRQWQVLQVRQAQRLAMEGLFGWVERCLLSAEATSVEELAARACDALEGDDAGLQPLSSLLTKFSYGSTDIDGLFSSEPPFKGASLFDEMDALEKVLRRKSLVAAVVPLCLNMLLRCATFARAFKDDKVAKVDASSGESFRMPLASWDAVMARFADRPVQAFFEHLLGTWIVSQHWRIAASRSGDERSRLRFSPEDQGLTSLLGPTQTALSAVRTGDRLQHVMALMASSGGVKADVPLRLAGSNPMFTI